ncbi:MAG: triphosphoribosyl-dephospho-CoA synthase [Haloarculaceae archaeon]
MRSVVQNAVLALLLEVTGTPKPGNVDRHRDHPDLRFEHFLAGAVGAWPGLSSLAGEAPLGEGFERAVAGMADQRGGNTQFGALLLLAPLVRAANVDGTDGDLSPAGAGDAVERTTVEDAVAFYRAFEHVTVAVEDPPEGLSDLDVRRGRDAAPALRERGLTLADVMALSADVDGVAAEWVGGFERTFEAGAWLLADDGPVPDRTSRAFLRLLADEVDTFVLKTAGREPAEEATRRARAVLDGEERGAELAREFVERGINPGTTADLTAGALFVALERGLAV